MWEFPKIRGTSFWGPYTKDPTIYIRVPYFRKLPYIDYIGAVIVRIGFIGLRERGFRLYYRGPNNYKRVLGPIILCLLQGTPKIVIGNYLGPYISYTFVTGSTLGCRVWDLGFLHFGQVSPSTI